MVSRLPPSPRCRGGRKGKAGVGVSLLHLSPHHAMPAAKAWLVRRTAQKGVGARTPAQLGRGGGTGLGAPRQTPRTRTSQGKERAGLRQPRSEEASELPGKPGARAHRVRAQTRRGAAGARASWKFPQQVLVAPLVKN